MGARPYQFPHPLRDETKGARKMLLRLLLRKSLAVLRQYYYSRKRLNPNDCTAGYPLDQTSGKKERHGARLVEAFSWDGPGCPAAPNGFPSAIAIHSPHDRDPENCDTHEYPLYESQLALLVNGKFPLREERHEQTRTGNTSRQKRSTSKRNTCH